MSELFSSKIMSINRLRIDTDGKGVSTLVAFYGCNLKCRYCINPQCNNSDTPIVDASPKQLVEYLSIDDIYFTATGGGVVFGGGEPLLQSEYIAEVCKEMPERWQRRVETSLNSSWEKVEILIPYINQWIVDIKDSNMNIYKKYTKIDGSKVYHNISELSKIVGKEKMIIRIPRIPGFNTEADIIRSVEKYKDFGTVEVFDYIKN